MPLTHPTEPAAPEEADDRVNILVVDDLQEKLMVFGTMLEGLGQHLVFVRSGAEALREVLAREFAVILLDVNMPDIDGFETAALIRRYRRSAHTPIIFITAYADELQTASGYSLGAVDYILSPVVPDVLRSKVKVFVELHQLQRRIARQAEERIALAESNAKLRAAAELQAKLQAEIAERRQAEAKLEEANRRKDEFLAMLSHELRNPLAPIRNAIEVIRRFGPQDAKIAWATDITDRQIRQLTRLVDELLDVARISQGKIVLRQAPMDLSALVAQCVETQRPFIAARKQLLTQALPGAAVWVRGDADRLQQVVNNLLNNAVKYTPEGGRLHLGLCEEGGQAVLSLRDNGIGIEAELLPRIFDLFEQGQRTLDRTQGGLGVGLTLVQRLVHMHGGRVEAASAGPGQGAEFRVYLPREAAAPDHAAGRAPAAEAGPAGRRIMLVEDNADVAETTAAMLTLAGHTVGIARDGVEALDYAQRFSPEVVLLDIGLPLMDGYEVARRLRALPQGACAMLIALTGYGQAADRQRGREAGFDEHLLKPVDPALLAEIIALAPRVSPAAAPAEPPAAATAPSNLYPLRRR